MNMPPITRRNFLADSAKASALLALGIPGQAAELIRITGGTPAEVGG